MNLNEFEITQLDSEYVVKVNGAIIKDVKSYSVTFDSDGNAEISLIISTKATWAKTLLGLAQPANDGRRNCTSNP